MQGKNIITLLALTAVVLFSGTFLSRTVQAQSSEPSGESLVEAINDFRQSEDMPALEINRYLMESAQKHAEYLASLAYLDHKGPNKTNETDRAVAAGYEKGANTICDEALAFSGPGVQLDIFFENTSIWNNYEHRDAIFLNPRYVDVGAGVAENNGSYYYVAVVCVNHSSTMTPQVTGALPRGGSTARIPTLTPTSDQPVPVEIATARPDGSIVHVVERGQVLWDIAFAYGIDLTDLATSNGLSPSRPVIYIGQEIVIRRAYTATPSATITVTPRPPTRTLRPSRTPGDPTFSPTITPTPTHQSPSILSGLAHLTQRQVGAAFVIICAAGLIILLFSTPKPKKKK